MLSVISLGSNMGDALANVSNAIQDIAQLPGVTLLKASSFYITEPWGFKNQDYFINAAISVETDIGSLQLLELLQGLETKYQRVRTIKNGPRTLDLDIIIYGDEISHDPKLNLPHPRANTRSFVLMPIAEILPDHVLPSFNATAKELLKSLPRGPATASFIIPDVEEFKRCRDKFMAEAKQKAEEAAKEREQREQYESEQFNWDKGFFGR